MRACTLLTLVFLAGCTCGAPAPSPSAPADGPRVADGVVLQAGCAAMEACIAACPAPSSEKAKVNGACHLACAKDLDASFEAPSHALAAYARSCEGPNAAFWNRFHPTPAAQP
jgi:hypothetical protein